MSLTNYDSLFFLVEFFEQTLFYTQAELYDSAKWNAIVSYLYSASPVLTTFASSTPAALVFSSWVAQCALLTVVFLGFVFYILSYGVKLLKTVTTNLDAYTTAFAYFADLEEEMGGVDDGLFYFLVFALVIVWFFFFTLWAGYVLSQSISWIVALFAIVGATAIFIPVFVLKNFGLAFVNYVRGGGRTSSLMFETMLDFVAVAVIMIRFMIQNIRFVFIFSAFFELYEYIYDKLNFDLLYTAQVAATSSLLNGAEHSAWYWYDLVGHYVLQWVLYLYYLGHLTLLFIAQLSIYFALSFWLFFFLYTTFTLETQEKYFLLKKI